MQSCLFHCWKFNFNQNQPRKQSNGKTKSINRNRQHSESEFLSNSFGIIHSKSALPSIFTLALHSKICFHCFSEGPKSSSRRLSPTFPPSSSSFSHRPQHHSHSSERKEKKKRRRRRRDSWIERGIQDCSWHAVGEI